jgi:hypothetical protein
MTSTKVLPLAALMALVAAAGPALALNPQPLPPGRVPIAALALNPQPLPPMPRCSPCAVKVIPATGGHTSYSHRHGR